MSTRKHKKETQRRQQAFLKKNSLKKYKRNAQKIDALVHNGEESECILCQSKADFLGCLTSSNNVVYYVCWKCIKKYEDISELEQCIKDSRTLFLQAEKRDKI